MEANTDKFQKIGIGAGISIVLAKITAPDVVEGAITSLHGTPTVAGTGYLTGEILTITTGGTLGKASIITDGVAGAVNALNATPTAGGIDYLVGETLIIDSEGGDGGATAEATAEVLTTDGLPGAVNIINSTPTAGGTLYQVGDTLTITTGGTGCTIDVLTVNAGTGAVETWTKLTSGSGYTTGAGKATSGGHGTLCTLNITSVRAGAVLSVAKILSGNGYTAGAGHATTGENGSGCTLNITSVRLGAVIYATLVTAGKDYTTGAGKATSGGSGTGCTLNIISVKGQDSSFTTKLGGINAESMIFSNPSSASARALAAKGITGTSEHHATINHTASALAVTETFDILAIV